MMVVRGMLFAVLLVLLGVGYFLGEPTLRQRVARMSCDEFMALKGLSLEGVRGRVGLIFAHGDMQVLADNCASYPGKPMAYYLGWQQYLGEQ